MIYLFAVFLVLGTLVFIHELGHYLAAKLFGVRVEVFSLGFGKRLWGFRRGDTDYRLSALPLGGYVKMAGENPLEHSTGDPAEFISKPRWQRLIIAAAGPAVNILFSVALVTVIFMVHFEHPAFLDRPAVIADVEQNSPAAAAGLAAGDQIVRVDSTETPNWEALYYRMLLDEGQTVRLIVLRNQQLQTKELTYNDPNSPPLDFLGVEPDQPYIIGDLSPEFPAAKAGMQKGDEILSLNGTPIHSTAGLSRILQESKDKPVKVDILRNGKRLSFTLVPKYDAQADGRYRIGVVEPSHVDRLPFFPALRASLQKNRQFSFLIVDLLERMVRHPQGIRKQVSGPIGIAQVSGEALKQGWLEFIDVLAIISLNLGIFNLLPIPILDGGLILMILIEGIIRRDIKREIKELVYQAAFVFLVIFAVFVIVNDITKTGVWQHLR